MRPRDSASRRTKVFSAKRDTLSLAATRTARRQIACASRRRQIDVRSRTGNGLSQAERAKQRTSQAASRHNCGCHFVGNRARGKAAAGATLAARSEHLHACERESRRFAVRVSSGSLSKVCAARAQRAFNFLSLSSLFEFIELCGFVGSSCCRFRSLSLTTASASAALHLLPFTTLF